MEKLTSEQESLITRTIRDTLGNARVAKGYWGRAGGVDEFMSRWEENGTLYVNVLVLDLKVGGPDDIDSNDGTAESELRKAVMSALDTKVPKGWEVRCGCGEKGWMNFYVSRVKGGNP